MTTARIFLITSIVTLMLSSLHAQNNQNNTYVPVNQTNYANNVYIPQQNNPVNLPTQQQVVNDDVNTLDNQEENNEDMEVNNFKPFQGNKFEKKEDNGTKDNNVNDNNSNPDEKPYCKECEELKKLKRQQTQQYFSGHVTGTANKHRWAKFCGRTNKKMQKWFAKDKKKRPNYSCFNW